MPSPDLGPEVIDAVASALMLDKEWTKREERGLSWWGHRLRQRVWADPPRESHGESVSCVHAESDVLVEVPPTDEVFATLAEINRSAHLNALVLDADSGRLSMRANAYFHEGNRWLIKDFKAAVALQAAEASAGAADLQQSVGGRIAVSEHPISGPRTEADNMLEVATVFVEQGAKRANFSRGDFSDAAREAAPFVIVGTYDDDGIVAELPFTGRRPATLDQELSRPEERRSLTQAYVDVARQKREKVPAVHGTTWLSHCATPDRTTETALVQIRSGEPHPRLGHGLLTLLWLPMITSAAEAARRANELNLLEASKWTEAHLLGAWTTEDGHLVFTSFTPNLVLAGSGSSALRARLVNNLVWSLIRARWVSQQL